MGSQNTAVGNHALGDNMDGDFDTGTGYFVLSHNTRGSYNMAVGTSALMLNTTGSDNTAVGANALSTNITGGQNTALGGGAGGSITTANNVIAIGTSGADVSDSCYIGNIWQQPGGSQAVYVNASGKLGAQVSSRRFKDEIKPMEQASEVIYSLKPVSFRYKPEIESTRPPSFGLIAEDIAAVN